MVGLKSTSNRTTYDCSAQSDHPRVVAPVFRNRLQHFNFALRSPNSRWIGTTAQPPHASIPDLAASTPARGRSLHDDPAAPSRISRPGPTK